MKKTFTLGTLDLPEGFEQVVYPALIQSGDLFCDRKSDCWTETKNTGKQVNPFSPKKYIRAIAKAVNQVAV